MGIKQDYINYKGLNAQSVTFDRYGKTVGLVYHVDGTNGLDTNSGRSWLSAFKTITAALAAATSANSTIYIAPGDYDEGAALTISVAGTKLIGVNPTPNGYPVMILGDSTTNDLLYVKANNVEIAGIGFVQTKAKACIEIGDDPAQGWYKCYIHGCKFDGWGTATYAITSTALADAPDLHVENCTFRSFATACIGANFTREMYNNNKFNVAADTIGISVIKTGSDRGDLTIDNNIMIGVSNASTTGIKFAGAIDVGLAIVSRNYFGGTWNTTITATTTTAGVNNYVADGSGGALIACNS